jgi:hypothetical protein
VPELERELRGLGLALDFPPTPDLATAVRRRLVEEQPRRGFALRRAVVLSFAVLAVAVGAVMAVPQARTAVLEWLGLRGVSIERTATQPQAPERPADLDLGERVSLAEASDRAPFAVRRSDVLGEPDEVYVGSRTPAGEVAFVYRGENGAVRALLTQFRGSLERDLIQKSAGPETTIEPVRVDGAPGFWLAGEPHEFVFLDERGEPVFETLRLATNTLVWQAGRETLRLEGDFTKGEALRIAESLDRR